jgi:hypothetical protein
MFYSAGALEIYKELKELGDIDPKLTHEPEYSD